MVLQSSLASHKDKQFTRFYILLPPSCLSISFCDLICFLRTLSLINMQRLVPKDGLYIYYLSKPDKVQGEEEVDGLKATC